MTVSVITETIMVTSISAAELAALVALGSVDIVDVRGDEEFAGGHIEGSRSIPLETLRSDPDLHLVRGVTLVFVCAKGIRSLAAAKLADRFGYDAVTLDGGTRSWHEAGFTLAPLDALAA